MTTYLEELSKETALAASAESSTFVSTSLTGVFVGEPTGTGVFNISYITPPGNNPEKSGIVGVPQCICVWEVENASAVYVSDPVIDPIEIIDSSSSGSKTIINFNRVLGKTYVVGYCYGTPCSTQNIHPIGALLTFAPGENTGVPTTPTLSTPTIIGSSTVLSSFTTPQGNNPYNNCNWCGLASGSVITNDGKQSWLKVRSCDSSMTNNNATAFIEGVNLTLNHTYTFAFGYQGPAGSPTVGMYYTFVAEPSS